MQMIEKTLEEFLEAYKISEEQFLAANMSWEELNKIYDMYKDRIPEYTRIGKELFKELFQEPKGMGLHLVYWRVKKPEHLIAKIIRKRVDNFKKYKYLKVGNYENLVNDLVGFRGLIVFREDWQSVHEKILEHFTDQPDLYLDFNDFREDKVIPNRYLAEAPTVHLREGDDKELYLKYIGEENILSKRNYRSVHYILKYNDVYVEIQIRTLFEEALGEIDHKIRYPNETDNEKFNRYVGVMNHLVGVADELGSIYLDVSVNDSLNRKKLSVKNQPINLLKDIESAGDQLMSTPSLCLDNILGK